MVYIEHGLLMAAFYASVPDLIINCVSNIVKGAVDSTAQLSGSIDYFDIVITKFIVNKRAGA